MYFTGAREGPVTTDHAVHWRLPPRPVPTGPFKPIQRELVCQTASPGNDRPAHASWTPTAALWLDFKSDDNANANGDSHTSHLRPAAE